MGVISFIVAKDMTGFSGLATVMVGPIVGYLAANVFQDKIHIDKEKAKDKKEGCGDGKCC